METFKFLMLTTHYPPYHLGGDAVMAQYLSNELVRRGHEVHVICDPRVYRILRDSRKPVNLMGRLEDGVSIHTAAGLDVKTHPLASLVLNTASRMRFSVEDLMRSIRPDVVHWHNTKGFVGIPFPAPGPALSLYTAHDYYLVCPRSNLLRPGMSSCSNPSLCSVCTVMWRKPPQLWRLMGRRVISPHKSLRIFAPSEFMAERLRMDGLKVNGVIRNFVPDNGGFFHRGVEERDDTDPMVLYVGMLEPNKGVSTLVRAFSLSENRHRFQLVIVGQGSMYNAIGRLVRKLKISNRVRLLGYVSNEELQRLRSRAMLQVVPSEWPENAPLTILESFSAGLPVLGSDAGGIPEMVSTESGSFLFKAADVADLSESLSHVWEIRLEIDTLRRRARQAYLRLYTPEAHISDYMRAIHSLDAT